MNENESDRDYVNIKIKEMKNLYEKKLGSAKSLEKDKDDFDIPGIRHRETCVKQNISLCQTRLEECKLFYLNSFLYSLNSRA